ncbi:hypothetical protein ATANTOWER_026239 [Ataeniobius toweri]|uniref:Uncharacterized protein n=1 Tax=Ataeniobius toweri TaxID=208326 RepID=A0ABU7AWB3_9TELE|nr:hypothetical protein [Ataeniobius toweri]
MMDPLLPCVNTKGQVQVLFNRKLSTSSFAPLPASAAGLCPYMAAAGGQSQQSRQLIQTARETGSREIGCHGEE